jgi:hypothetical protein
VTHTALYDELAARAGIRLDGGREDIRGAVPTRGAAATAQNRPVHGGAGDQPARLRGGQAGRVAPYRDPGRRFSLCSWSSPYTPATVSPQIAGSRSSRRWLLPDLRRAAVGAWGRRNLTASQPREQAPGRGFPGAVAAASLRLGHACEYLLDVHAAAPVGGLVAGPAGDAMAHVIPSAVDNVLATIPQGVYE